MGKNFPSISKPDRHLVIGFISEVLACVEEDVSGEVDGVNPTHMCRRSFGVVVQRYKEVCEGGTKLL